MKKKLLVGPHHGEHPFPGYDGYYGKVVANDIGYVVGDKKEWPEGDYIESKDLMPYLKTHEYVLGVESDLTWGHFTEIILTVPFDDDESSYDWRKLELIREYVKIIMVNYFDAFINSGGDDDTYDYMPSFTESLEQIMELLGHEEDVKRINKACLCTMKNREDAESMEFFGEDELDEMFPKK